jgi:hypothetical protein
MNDTQAEIARVEKALATTTSPYLKRDYTRYLYKLRRRLKKEKYQKGA